MTGQISNGTSSSTNNAESTETATEADHADTDADHSVLTSVPWKGLSGALKKSLKKAKFQQQRGNKQRKGAQKRSSAQLTTKTVFSQRQKPFISIELADAPAPSVCQTKFLKMPSSV